MIDELKPYEGYKETGLPWLAATPSHWSLRRTKFLFQERTQKDYPNEPLLAATQTKGVGPKRGLWLAYSYCIQRFSLTQAN